MVLNFSNKAGETEWRDWWDFRRWCRSAITWARPASTDKAAWEIRGHCRLCWVLSPGTSALP